MLSDRHPSYIAMQHNWKVMRDTYAGEHQVKEQGEEYLPATPGQLIDGMPTVDSIGWKNYRAYKARAVFPDHVNDAVGNMLGLLHSKPAEIKLPAALEMMMDNATTEGETLQQLLERITEQQLVAGRLGLLLDMPAVQTTKPRPYIALYIAERIFNWDEGRVDDPEVKKLNLVVLNESENERAENGFTWKQKEKIRVLQLGKLSADEPVGTYSQGLYTTDTGLEFQEDKQVAPLMRGQPAKEIPFVFCNTRDTLVHPDNPPLLGLGRLAVACYRGDADYRQTLFMQGQETLVVVGGTEGEEIRVGANARIDVSIGGDAKYVGIGHQGISEQRQALADLNRKASIKGGEMLDSSSSEKESGDALRIRVGARAATLTQVATTAAFALTTILRMAARWIGANEAEVVVNPNLDFVTEPLAGQDLAQIMTAKQLGAPISNKSIHDLLRRRGMTTMTFEEEKSEIDDEPPPITGGANDNGAGPNNLKGGGPGNDGT